MENNQREITHKILKQELWFLCMTHRLIMLNKCTKFSSHLLIAGCDIGVQISVSPSVRSSVRSSVNIYVEV